MTGFWSTAAQVAGILRPRWPVRDKTIAGPPLWRGVSVVIPSRNGRHLLEAQLPGIMRQSPPQVIVVDNGSGDGTAEYLRAAWPAIEIQISAAPLSFARAVNRGLARTRYSHLCLLNNDMLVEPGFFEALARPFERIPNLFCATAQILFPPGVRREETGKAVMAQAAPEDFPVRCDEPLPGEDLTFVLYGSGGCSLYDVAKLRALGGVDEAYDPAYVEDLDLGYRAWQRGWPSVYAAGAVVEHRHRATTSRYYTRQELDRILEINYLKFLARAVASPQLFRRLWQQALHRLPQGLLAQACAIALAGGPLYTPECAEEEFLALTGGAVSAFPGGAPDGEIAVLCADELEPPAPELLARHAEVVIVRGEKNSPACAAARKWYRAATRWSPAPRPR